MKMRWVGVATVVVLFACGEGGGGNTGGGNGGNGTVDQYPDRVHLKLTLKYSKAGATAAGDQERWQGTFEGHSSSSTISGVNQVYAFDNSLDTVSGASHDAKSCAGAGPCDEVTDTIDGLSASALSLTVGPTSFSLQSGQLSGPFFGFLTDETSFGAGIRALDGAKQVSFSGKVPAKLDSRCPADSNVTSTGLIALDGDVFTGYAIRQTYTCTADSITWSYENVVQITAL